MELTYKIKMLNKKRILLLITIGYLLFIINSTLAYTVESGEEVHQYLTNESQKVWEQTPNEINGGLKSEA